MMARAIRFGLIAAAIALLLWPAFAVVQAAALRLPFMAALAVSAVCGVAILVMSVIDLITVRRSRSVLPARMFDLALGLVLAVPSGSALLSML
jgi:hypothetical protein